MLLIVLTAIRKFLGLRVRVGTVLVALVACVLCVAVLRHRPVAPLLPGVTVTVNDSTQAQGASAVQAKHTLPSLTDAAQTLHGKLVAGVTFTTKADSAVRPLQGVITSRADSSDSSRSASVDTVLASGIALHVDAKAPAYPAKLEIGYVLTVPAFSPAVGFVEVGKGYAAVVSWGGQTFTTRDAFYTPPSTPHWALTAGATAQSSDWEAIPDVNVGLSRRLGRTDVAVVYEVGQGHAPRTKVRVSRTLWSH